MVERIGVESEWGIDCMGSRGVLARGGVGHWRVRESGGM